MSKSPSLRRIKADIRELSIDPSDQYYAAPLESDMFEWHFTIRGPADSEFAGGVYHGRILLPPEYPFKPPNIVFLTPSGRFETNTKVCLSFSAHHPELWQPAWGIRLILEALISFLPTPADGAIGALDWTKEERQKLAKESVKFHCPACCAMGQSCTELLPELKKQEDGSDKKKSKFQEEIEKLKILQFQNHAAVEEETADGTGSKEEESKQSSTDENEKLTTPLPESGAQKEVDQEEKKTETKSQSETAPLPVEKEEQSSNNDASSNANATPEQSSTSDNKAKSPPSTTNTNTAEVASNVTNAPATAVPPSIDNQRDTPVTVPPPPQDNVIVSDPFLNGMIAAFAVVVVYLLREAHSLLEELRDIQSQL